MSFCWPVRVYYEDTDAGGIVYHARYLAFFERARTEMLRAIGIYQADLLTQNIAIVVRKMDIDYLRTAKLDDLLQIDVDVVKINRASINLSQKLTDEQGNLVCQAQVILACVDTLKKKPIVFPKLIVAELNSD